VTWPVSLPTGKLSCFVTEAPAVEELRQLNPVSTPRTPYLEFESPPSVSATIRTRQPRLLFQHRRQWRPTCRTPRLTRAPCAARRFVAAVSRSERPPACAGWSRPRRGTSGPGDLSRRASSSCSASTTCVGGQRAIRTTAGHGSTWRRSPWPGLIDEAEWFRQVYQLTERRDEHRARALVSRSVVGLAECLRRVVEARSAQHLLAATRRRSRQPGSQSCGRRSRRLNSATPGQSRE
jgi:hypothetical protein